MRSMSSIREMNVGPSVVARWLDIATRIDDRNVTLLHPLCAFNRQGRRRMLQDALAAAERSAGKAQGGLEQQMAIVLAAEIRAALHLQTSADGAPQLRLCE